MQPRRCGEGGRSLKYAWILAALLAAHAAPQARAEAQAPGGDPPPAAGEAAEPLPPGSVAAPSLLGVEVQLPFEHRLRWWRDAHGGGRAAWAARRIEAEVEREGADGPVPVALIVTYRGFPGMPSSELGDIAQELADKAVADGRARSAERFSIDGFPFHLMQGEVRDDEHYRARMGMHGVVNDGYFSFNVYSADEALLTPELAAALRAAKLDYAALLRLKARFEEEAEMAMRDGALDTPLSRIELDGRSQARLVASTITRDADGGIIRRQRDFAIFKAGFWTLQSLALEVSCGRDDHPGWDAEDFLLMTTALEDEDEDARPIDVSAPAQATLFGLPALATTAKGPRVNTMRRSDIRRWLVRHEGMAYGIGLSRVNGSPVEKQLLAQFQAGEPRCQLGLQFGDDAVAGP